MDLRQRCATFGTAATVVSTGILEVGVVLIFSTVVVEEWVLKFSVVEKIDVNRVDRVLGITKACVGARHTAAAMAKTTLEVTILMLNCWIIGREINGR